MVAQDILVVLVLVRTQVSQPKTSPENHFRGCLYFTIIRTLSFYLGSTYIRCGHTYTPSRHEIKRHTTLRQTRLILPLFFSAPNDFSISGKRFFVLRQMIFVSLEGEKTIRWIRGNEVLKVERQLWKYWFILLFYRSLCSVRIKRAVLFFRKERWYITFAKFEKRDAQDVMFIEKMP